MARPILVDTTRLLTRLKHDAPTGIDRVDLAYARHFLRGSYAGQAAAATPFGIRLLPDRQVTALFDAIDRRWAEAMPTAEDRVLARIRAWLNGAARRSEPGPGTVQRARRRKLPVAEIARMARSTLWQEAARVPQGAIYLHTSHLRLDRPELFSWLDRRPDVRSVFFVHDIIPIEHPEYGVPGEAGRHRIRMRTVAQRAAAVVVSSQAVRRTLTRYLEAEGLRVPPIEVAAIGVEPAFQVQDGPALSARRPYFVVCSTIEARKNHLLLLQVWRELAAQMGPATPALVIVGRRGWESENVVDLLERCPAMHDHVLEAPGLSTPGLVQLLRGARALLMPSFAEGYGIPVVEALSLGTPVIASDLPVHGEIAGPHAWLLHPLDGLGWRDAIRAASETPPPAPSGFRPPLWRDHFGVVDRLVAAL